MGPFSEATAPYPSERPTDVIPQADGDSGRVTDEEWDEFLRREYLSEEWAELRRALLEDFRV